MEIDPRFKAARKKAARRRTKSWLVPTLVWGGGSVGLCGAVLALWLSGVLTFGAGGSGTGGTEDDLAVMADAGMQDAAASYTTPFLDLAGDPMRLRFDVVAGAEKTRPLDRPPEIPPDRVGRNLMLLTDDLITTEERLITTLPSSREDFAFFQSKREAPVLTPGQMVPQEVAAENTPLESVVVEGEDASWGEDLAGIESDAPDSFTRTRIENTTSLAFLLRENQRRKPYDDIFLRLKEATDFTKLLVDNGIDPAAAKRFAEAAPTFIPETAALVAGHIIAIRWADRAGLRVPVQVSLYSRDEYLGSLAVNDEGRVVISADPWVEEDLFTFAEDTVLTQVDAGRKYRLLDAFYSAAIRNGVPSDVVAESIVLMSQAHDLEAFAAPGDRMTLVYGQEPGTEEDGAGRVLYAAINGEGRKLICHVFRDPAKQEYSCYRAPGAGSGGGIGLRSGLVTPVQGVLTSRFGPRMHPVLKVPKLHKGVDWAAPIGTPVHAAFDGVIAAAGDGQGYGNLVRITHAGGLETRYAHLNAFADGIRAGEPVSAGTLIGYVGTTGLSTGPHLHFELYENGEPVDPLGAGGSDAVIASDSSAVEMLVDQIIRVESGGRADAKNPLSSAVGVGQFVRATWLRMIKQYRPDLAAGLTEDEILALRLDPTLSREMVTNLAREGEAYLRARGHSINAGRLYLCHFLGQEGANKVLNAQDDQLVIDVMGAGVVNANPFLNGMTIAGIKDWADRKMSGKGGSSTPLPPPVPPEVLAYQKVIERLLGSPT